MPKFIKIITNVHFKYLMQVTDPGTAFFFIMQFIHTFGAQINSEALNNLKSKSDRNRSDVLDYDNNFLEEIRDIGFNRILDANDDFTNLKIQIIDHHCITLKISRNQLEYTLDSFPNIFVTSLLTIQKGFLSKIIKSATADYKRLDDVCSVFLKIDNSFPTLQPERMNSESLKRRIYLSYNEEIILSFDFDANKFLLSSYSDCSSSITSESFDLSNNSFEILMKKLTQILKSFDPINTPLECGICYSDYLEGQLAAFNCPNALNCKQIYHESCLKNWFRANPESKTIFDQISGNCLFCDKV